MTKKIIVLFDGTWNLQDDDPVERSENTNVAKMHDAILAVDSQGIMQKKWYEPGVGTDWYNRISGGAFGVGLSEKIQDGYRFLIKHYEPGDQIFIFGFSRGAYSARSLVGLIRNAGLLMLKHEDMVGEAYSLYRSRDKHADADHAKLFRQTYSREIDIHFLGVWDTVGALGVPLESFGWFNKQYYNFHDTELSGIVKNAFQALAIDEHRKNYDCAIWDPKYKPQQTVEQVWFAGAHSNIGGGYAGNNLSDIALEWMMQKARSCGLDLDIGAIPNIPFENCYTSTTYDVTDSYSQFLNGAYGKLEPRFYRRIGITTNGQEAISETVKNRIAAASSYKPRNPVGINLCGTFIPINRLYP